MNKPSDVDKATKKYSALRDASRAERAESTSIRSANLPRPVKWLGHFPSMAATNKFLALMNKSLDGGRATNEAFDPT
jgi:hypothetical protein